MNNILHWPREKLHSAYNWSTKWAQSKNAERALAIMSFAESSFFPIPPDPLLMAMVFSKTDKWLRFALITTVASVLGGVFGYILGATLFISIGDWIVQTYHLQQDFAQVQEWYNNYSFIAVLGAAITPVPYKIFTISAGLFRINFFGFFAASVIGRGMRFFAVTMLASYLGKNHKDAIEKYIDRLSIAILLIAILAIALTR